MKFIKIYGAVTLLIGLIFLGLNILGNSDEKEKLELELTKGEVAPMEEWEDILIGKWNFSIERKEPGKIHVHKGQIEYFLDSTLFQLQDYKLYIAQNGKRAIHKTDKFLAIHASGTSKGSWFYEKKSSDVIDWFEAKIGECQYALHYHHEGEELEPCIDLLEDMLLNIQDRYFGANIPTGIFFVALNFTERKIVLRETNSLKNDSSYYIFSKVD